MVEKQIDRGVCPVISCKGMSIEVSLVHHIMQTHIDSGDRGLEQERRENLLPLLTSSPR